jgi:hypothetical protein
MLFREWRGSAVPPNTFFFFRGFGMRAIFFYIGYPYNPPFSTVRHILYDRAVGNAPLTFTELGFAESRR